MAKLSFRIHKTTNAQELYNVSVNYGDSGEFEAKIIFENTTIIITPVNTGMARLSILAEDIDVYTDNGPIDVVVLHLNRPLATNVLIRFPNIRQKTAFIDKIHVVSDNSGVSTGSSPTEPEEL